MNMTERVLFQVQVAEMGFLGRVHSVTLRDKVRNCESCEPLDVEPLFRIRRSQPCWFGCVTRMSNERLTRKFCWLHSCEIGPEVVQEPTLQNFLRNCSAAVVASNVFWRYVLTPGLDPELRNGR